MPEQRALDLDIYLADAAIPEGQKRRLGLFKSVEAGVCERVELLCEESGVEVNDVAVLVIAPAAHGLFFDDDVAAETNVILGHRDKLYSFLNATLPATPEAPFDPYADLLEPAPVQCVRVLIIDDESLTVMSYGTFVTVRMDNRAAA